MNIHNSKKHVRFNTPSKSDPRLMEYLQNRPSVYFCDDPDIDNSPKHRRSNSPNSGNLLDNEDQIINNMDSTPSNTLNYQIPNLNPPIRSIKQNISPNPSHDLELSLLDSTPPDFMANIYNRVFPYEEKTQNILSKLDDFSKPSQYLSTHDEGLSKKMYESDMPYMNLPSKTPIPKSISSLPSNLLTNIPSVTSNSQQFIESAADKRETNDGLGFFTLPNSKSYFTEKNDKSSLKQSSSKYEFNHVLQAKNNYQHHTPRLDNNEFHNDIEIIERQDPRCCNDKPPKPMLLPKIPTCNGPLHYNHSQNNTPRYPLRVEYNQNNRQSPNFVQPCDVNYMQINPVQRCCWYPTGNNVNYCQTQNCHTRQYSNNNVQQTHRCDCRECHQHTDNQVCNTMPKTNVSNGVDLKQKAIESRFPSNAREDNKCNDIVQANAAGMHAATDTKVTPEPTVFDLYHIIKMQNEQLQVLQQRVDKLLSVKESVNDTQQLTEDLIKPMHNLLSNQDKVFRKDNVNMNCIEQSMHKISIGVMTSFELVMSSNIINNKDIVFNSTDKVNSNNNRDECIQTSQMFENFQTCQNKISANKDITDNDGGGKNNCGVNFLDGIAHCNKGNDPSFLLRNSKDLEATRKVFNENQNRYAPAGLYGDDHARQNSLSTQSKEYYTAVQVKNDTRQLVPNSSLHIDEFSDSEDECSQPNVGWTFYNNVMVWSYHFIQYMNRRLAKPALEVFNRVNDMLHSPPAINNGNKKDTTLQVHRFQLDNAQNVPTVKRSKVAVYSDNPRPTVINHIAKPVTETSLHMKRLAAKYLHCEDEPMRHESKVTFSPHVNVVTPGHHRAPYIGDMGNEMSFATLQYMKRYHLMTVNGDPNHLTRSAKKSNFPESPEYLKPIYKNPSRILDITTLKQQPKLM